MDYMKGYRLEPNEQGYTIIFYLDEHYNEFSNEITPIKYPSDRKLKNFRQYVIDNFSHLNIRKVKVMIGPALVMSFALALRPDHGPSEAASQKRSTHAEFQEVDP
ncbi:hypothetical protein [Alkalibacillus silvisoli]|uniref:Uncharacterized protein n=1 Tax=Alkalibacillus silvisoli TaxID=392823 RepID=A0ABP3JHU0_9BACI